jgi:methyl-accepting chemotaxis protein
MGTINTIDVEKIMEEIRAEIKEKGYTSDMLSFQDVQHTVVEEYSYNEAEYLELVRRLNTDAYVPWYRDLGVNGVKRFVKKVIRRMISFVVAPMSEEQNRFNSEVCQAVNQLQGYIEQQKHVIETCQKNINLLEEKIARLEKSSGTEEK